MLTGLYRHPHCLCASGTPGARHPGQGITLQALYPAAAYPPTHSADDDRGDGWVDWLGPLLRRDYLLSLVYFISLFSGLFPLDPFIS